MRVCTALLSLASVLLVLGTACTEKDGLEEEPEAPPGSETHRPLHVFYVIHLHVSDDRLPYVAEDGGSCLPADLEGCVLDTDKVETLITMTEKIAAVLEAHGLRGSFQATMGPLKGICTQESGEERHLFQRLRDAGHEVGIHTHSFDHVEVAQTLLEETCGLPATRTASGFEVWDKDLEGDALAEARSERIAALVARGIDVGTTNTSPTADPAAPGSYLHDMMPPCTGWGVDNDSWTQGTDNIVYPWKPDYAGRMPCVHNGSGGLVLLDHAQPDWLVTESGKANTVTSTHFDQLIPEFDAALAYVEAAPSRIGSWGFVSHVTEYHPGNDLSSPVAAESLEALDAFLSYMDVAHNDFRVKYTTPEALADAIFPDE